MSIEHRNFIDYFAVCGLDVKSGLEPEPNEANGKLTFLTLFRNSTRQNFYSRRGCYEASIRKVVQMQNPKPFPGQSTMEPVRRRRRHSALPPQRAQIPKTQLQAQIPPVYNNTRGRLARLRRHAHLFRAHRRRVHMQRHASFADHVRRRVLQLQKQSIFHNLLNGL